MTKTISIANQSFKWNKLTIPKDSIIQKDTDSNQFFLLASYVSVQRWMELTFKFKSNALFEIYIDGKLESTKSGEEMSESKLNTKLNIGKHSIIIKFLSLGKETKFSSVVSFEEKYAESDVLFNLDPLRTLTIDDILSGTELSSFQVSPSGIYLLSNYSETDNKTGKSKKYSILKNLRNGNNLAVFRNQNINQVKWLPTTDRLSYTISFEEATDLFVYDVVTANEKMIATGIKDFSNYQWSPTEEFLIYSAYIKDEKTGPLKRIYGNNDRLPYFRNRSFLHLIYAKSGNSVQLTSGNLSTYLQDIHPSRKKALVSTSRVDHTEVPFSKQSLYEIDLTTHKLNTIWENKKYGGYAQYSPNGSKLLVQGGPECFDNTGKNVSKGRIANSYDQQLYIFDLQTKKADPITRKFDPSIDNAYWSKPNELFIAVTEKDYGNFYKYSINSKKFKKIDIETEVLSQIKYAKNQPIAVYSGTSISTPNKLFQIDLNTEKSKEIDFPDKEKFENIEFGSSEKWNFLNKNKTTIYGRVYYPPGYDKTKKYPVIVNYYGGTSPIERSFGGRYPINIWAANNYIVYVMQPSGATGFGQDFSALHVNGWGKDAIDDIIDGTKEFLKTHSSADAANVGCIGASYGGYTTMLLQTRTDIFKTAISHAGISSITSYWGEGYWGYSYSAGATTHSYPWNRKDIYVDNSPLYNADKFKNSILLLHGTDDTNVPVGESLQFYAALKILGKDVEMVLVEGQNHWIVDFEKRKKWHYTIISWFDKKLKNQSEEWDEMYPEKNL